MKNGLDRTLLRVCGFLPKPYSAKRCSGEPPLDLDIMPGIIVESVTWVTESSPWEQERITDTNVITLRENEILEALNYEIDVPCPLHWGLIWFSAPTNLNQKFVCNGTKIENSNKKNQPCNYFDVQLCCWRDSHPTSIVCTDSDGAVVQCPR